MSWGRRPYPHSGHQPLETQSQTFTRECLCTALRLPVVQLHIPLPVRRWHIVLWDLLRLASTAGIALGHVGHVEWP